jgi:chromosome segregation ATPase
LQQKILSLSSSQENLKSQMSELQSGYGKQREQLRSEELKNETAELTIKKLVVKIERIQEEATQQQADYERMHENTEKQLVAMRESYEAVCGEKDVLIQNLHEELRRQFSEMSVL